MYVRSWNMRLLSSLHRKSCWPRETAAAIKSPSLKIQKWKLQTHHIISFKLWNWNEQSVARMQHALQPNLLQYIKSDKLLTFHTNSVYIFNHIGTYWNIKVRSFNGNTCYKEMVAECHEKHTFCVTWNILNLSFTGMLEGVLKVSKT